MRPVGVESPVTRACSGVSLDEALDLVRKTYARAETQGGMPRAFSIVLTTTIRGRAAYYSDFQAWDLLLHYGAVAHHAAHLDRKLSGISAPYGGIGGPLPDDPA